VFRRLRRTLDNTGARASELSGIRITDLDLDRKQVLLYGKGRKKPTVPLLDSTTAFLRTYLKSERRVALTPYRDFLFINQRRARLTRSGVFYICSQYLAQAACEVPSIERKRLIRFICGVAPRPVTSWKPVRSASGSRMAGRCLD
jgi:site-specific recombinase XerD